MNSAAALRAEPSTLHLTDLEIQELGKQVIGTEARALLNLLGQIDETFSSAVQMLFRNQGNLIVTGMGKAGLIGQKLAATFASTGTRAQFLHPAEAIHGDLGRVSADDVVFVLSQSGETEEVVQLLPSLAKVGVPLLALTASSRSTLGRRADITLELGKLQEACFLGLAPSTSTTAMLALGDALALVVSRLKGFTEEDFALNHPGGSLGRKLSLVEDYMRDLSECRIAGVESSIRQVLVECTRPGRRTGAIMLIEESGNLVGLFTDSDLVRLLESRKETALDQPISEAMITSPTVVSLGDRMSAAIEILTEHKISELPVVDESGRPAGLIDVTDVLSFLPDTHPFAPEDNEPPTVRLFSGDQ